jgi:hypothetical protein
LRVKSFEKVSSKTGIGSVLIVMRNYATELQQLITSFLNTKAAIPHETTLLVVVPPVIGAKHRPLGWSGINYKKPFQSKGLVK